MFWEEKQNKKRKILFENHKKTLKMGFIIYTDHTIIGYVKAISSKGISFQKEIGRYFQIPETENEQQKIIVDYLFKTPKGMEKFTSIPSELYSEKRTFTTRKKEKVRRNVVLLKPQEKSVLKKLCELIKKYQKITYVIRKQLSPTKKYSKIKSIRERVSESLNVDFSKLELIIVGGWQNAQFEIYKNDNKHFFIKSNTKINRWGKVTLSSELNNHVIDFFKYNEFVCKKNDEPPIVIPTVTRVINSKIKIEANFPHYSNKNEQIELVFTHPDFRLTSETLADYEMKKQLKNIGYPIKSFYTRYFNGHHSKRKIEERMRYITKNAFSSSEFEIFSDVQLIFDYPHENDFGNKHVFDDLIINKDDNSLILVEYKTVFGKKAKYRETDYAIARLQHFQKKLGKNVYLILMIYGDLYNNNRNITRQFGNTIDMLLIGKNELEELYQKPSLLIKRINDIKTNEKNKVNDKKNYHKSPLYNSIQNLPFDSQNLLEKNKNQLFCKIPTNYQFYSTISIKNSGGEFETEIQEFLEKEGFSVVSNLVIKYSTRRMEIDMLAFKKDSIVAVSCRNALNVTCLRSLRMDIKLKAYKIEQRMRLLNADSARLYIRVTKENYSKLKDYEGTWVESVEIVFITV